MPVLVASGTHWIFIGKEMVVNRGSTLPRRNCRENEIAGNLDWQIGFIFSLLKN